MLSIETCPDCCARGAAERLGVYKATAKTRQPALVDARLRAIGLGLVERRAMLGKIPPAIRRVLPRGPIQDLINGNSPATGFGLVGGQGVGKTMTLAAVVRAHVEVRASTALEVVTSVPYREEDEQWHLTAGRVLWWAWPSQASAMKALVTRPDGNGRVESLVSAAIRVPLLVLDDLGRERVRGSYIEDFAVGQLDRIVDARVREERPILWTANAAESALVGMYGGAMMSRLLSIAPAVELPSALPDLRLDRAG